MRPGRRQQDVKDLKKITEFLERHNPFTIFDDSLLINIATGLVANENVNCDDALKLGKIINSKMDGQAWEDITLSKSDQAK